MPDLDDWTEEQHHRLQLMLRYKVAAERSFHWSVAALEWFRRTRVCEAIAMERAVEEKTVTSVSPSNADLVEKSKTMEEPPARVFRSINIQPWLPDEYAWVNDLPGTSNSREQVMTVEEWGRAMEREKEIEGGHLGPAELEAAWVSWWRAAYPEADRQGS